MRKILKSLPFLIVINFLFIDNGQVYAQDKVSLSAGLGIPELINAGVQYRINQTQIGVGVGYFPPSGSAEDPTSILAWGTLRSVSGDIFYHFGRLPKSSDLTDHPWYLRIGFIYSREEQRDKVNSVFFISPRIGRDFNISERAGISADLGINMAHYLSDPTVPDYLSLFGLPGIGIRVFYRI